MGLGIVQSFVILRILSVGDWGIVQLAVSVGASLGIYQHLGLASASNREIAAAEEKTDIFKIFVTTAIVRYFVTIPLSVGLYYFAPKLTQVYGFEQLLIPLRIYAIVILLQGVQAILNSVISGTKRFKELFLFQIFIAGASVLIYIPFVYFYGILGFFYAFLIHEAIKSITLFVIGFKPFIGKMNFPSREEFNQIFKNLFSLGLSIFFVKVLVLNWEKLGTNLLGFSGDAEILGIYAFALLYAKKLVNVSDAVTDVNLPVFSESYAKNPKSFMDLFLPNFNKLFSLIVFFAFSAVFWARDIINILIGSNKYDESLPIILPMVFAFIFFSLLDIIKSSVAIPAKLKLDMIFSYVLLFVITAIAYFITRTSLSFISAMSYSMLLGGFIGLLFLVFRVNTALKYKILNHSHYLLLIQAFVVGMVAQDATLLFKIPVYILLVALYLWGARIAGFVAPQDFLRVKNFTSLLGGKLKK